MCYCTLCGRQDLNAERASREQVADDSGQVLDDLLGPMTSEEREEEYRHRRDAVLASAAYRVRAWINRINRHAPAPAAPPIIPTEVIDTNLYGTFPDADLTGELAPPTPAVPAIPTYHLPIHGIYYCFYFSTGRYRFMSEHRWHFNDHGVRFDCRVGDDEQTACPSPY